MTVSLGYILGSGNSLVWSWFFWVYVHPIASIMWFAFCIFALLISIEIHQIEASDRALSRTSNLRYVKKSKPIKYATSTYASNPAAFSATEVIEVIVKPPPQLTYSKNVSSQKQKPQMAQMKMMQLPSSID